MTDKTIAVDFDGVIHAYSKGWHDGTIYDGPVFGAIEGLWRLMDYCAVFVHTTRSAGQVAEWLAGYGFDVVTHSQAEGGGEPLLFWTRRDALLVTNQKLPAVAYLDDRAVRFTSWGAALRELLPDEARAARTERAERALIEAWPDIDGVFAEQAVQVILAALEADHG